MVIKLSADELEQLENGPWPQFAKDCKELVAKIKAEGARQERERILATITNMVEPLADLAHEQWSGWTRWMIDKWSPEMIERWERQIRTPYADLSEREKESDRIEARKVISKVLELIKEASN